MMPFKGTQVGNPFNRGDGRNESTRKKLRGLKLIIIIIIIIKNQNYKIELNFV